MNPLSSQEIVDFISKLSTPSTKTLVIFFDKTTGIGFTVVGKLKLIGEGWFSVQGEGDVGLTDSSSFNASVVNLVHFPCVFTDPRDFKGNPRGEAFFKDEVRINFGLTFSLPSQMLSIMELVEAAVEL